MACISKVSLRETCVTTRRRSRWRAVRPRLARSVVAKLAARVCAQLLSAGACVLVLTASACSLLIDVDKNQCAQDVDCKRPGLSGVCSRGVCVAAAHQSGGQAVTAVSPSCDDDHPCDPDGADVCFKEQCAPPHDVEPFVCMADAPSQDATVAYSVHVQEFVSKRALKQLAVTACRANDVGCEQPVLHYSDTAGKGDVTLQLPLGFVGYLELRSSDALPGLYYVTQPVVSATHAKPLQLIAPMSLQLLAAASAQTVDMDAGLVVLEAYDCNGNAVGGIHFEQSKQSGIAFVIVDSLPTVDRMLTVRDDVNDGAIGGFLNVDPGNGIFSARLGQDGPVLGSFNASVRAGTVTYIDIHP
jgi:hypothetical protein